MKASKIYIILESEELSPMEILLPILEKAKSLGVNSPEYEAIDYQGCDNPRRVLVVPIEEGKDLDPITTALTLNAYYRGKAEGKLESQDTHEGEGSP